MLNNGKPKHIILAGDFNCPDITWSNMTINPKAPEKEVQQQFIDLSTEFNLTQVHDIPTREDSLLDIVLTTNATLVKSSTNIPGLSDHDIIITDAIIKPTYNKNKPQKRYQYCKAFLTGIR
jgi:endonuclease/exonuclease/phosphatase (EEP) superfamily protein YafD